MDKSRKMERLRQVVQEDTQQLEDVLTELESRVDFLLSHLEESPDDWVWSQNR